MNYGKLAYNALQSVNARLSEVENRGDYASAGFLTRNVQANGEYTGGVRILCGGTTSLHIAAKCSATGLQELCVRIDGTEAARGSGEIEFDVMAAKGAHTVNVTLFGETLNIESLSLSVFGAGIREDAEYYDFTGAAHGETAVIALRCERGAEVRTESKERLLLIRGAVSFDVQTIGDDLVVCYTDCKKRLYAAVYDADLNFVEELPLALGVTRVTAAEGKNEEFAGIVCYTRSGSVFLREIVRFSDRLRFLPERFSGIDVPPQSKIRAVKDASPPAIVAMTAGGIASAFTFRRDFSRRSGSAVSFIISVGVDDNV